MRRVAILLPVLALGLWAGAALADNQPPPGFQAAFDTCKSQGLTPGTNDFNKCIAGIIGAPAKGSPPPKPAGGPPGGKPADGTPPPGGGSKPADGTPPPGGGGSSPTTAAGKAAQACIAQGVAPKSAALNQCVARALLSGPEQTAWDACVSQGQTPGSDAFASCVNSQLHGSDSPLTARQQDDVDYCLGKGLKQGTADFKSCIQTAGKAKLPANVQAAIDECQSQGITDPAEISKCVGELTKVPVPPKDPGGEGKGAPPTAKNVQAAFDDCIAGGAKPGTADFTACVRKALSS